jgi:hypothetical protein
VKANLHVCDCLVYEWASNDKPGSHSFGYGRGTPDALAAQVLTH